MSTENTYNKESRAKIKELVEDIRVAMMATNLGSTPLSVIPMFSKKVDEDGNIWFLSGKNSDHNSDINKSSETHLIYGDPKAMEYLSVYGKSSIIDDKKILEELYSNVTDNWFNGVDDPNLSAIKFEPKEAYYWDTKSNKYVAMFKLAWSSLTGATADIGKTGHIKL